MFSGKSLSASLLKLIFAEKYPGRPILIKAFADPVKDALSLLYKIPRELFDSREGKASYAPDPIRDSEGNLITLRRLMQLFGTNGGRNGFHQNTWVWAMQRDIAINAEPNSIVIIPDCRFSNELGICDIKYYINRTLSVSQWVELTNLIATFPQDLFNPEITFKQFVKRVEILSQTCPTPLFSEFLTEAGHASELNTPGADVIQILNSSDTTITTLQQKLLYATENTRTLL